MKVLWNPSETPQELHSILQTIAEEYPVESSAQNANVKFRLLPDAPDGLKVSWSTSCAFQAFPSRIIMFEPF